MNWDLTRQVWRSDVIINHEAYVLTHFSLQQPYGTVTDAVFVCPHTTAVTVHVPDAGLAPEL